MHISPTCVGRDPPLPLFNVPLYQPYPLPWRKKMPKELGATRLQGLMEEAQELSEEEREFEEKCKDLRMRGWNYMVPLGKTLTLREEKIDQGSEASSDIGDVQDDNASAGAENDVNAPANTTAEDGEGDEQDLDAGIDDLDEEEEEEEPEPEEEQEPEEPEEQEDEEEEDDLDAPLMFDDLMA